VDVSRFGRGTFVGRCGIKVGVLYEDELVDDGVQNVLYRLRAVV